MFNRRLLRSSLKNFFESHIFSRGVDYYNDHCVAGLKIFPVEDEKKIIIKGKVAGSDYYDASLFFDIKNNKFGALNCSCPYDDNCKHLAALGLEFIDALEEFAQSNVFNSDNNFREKLVSWINKREKALNYQESEKNSEFYDNEKEDYENKILKKSNKKPTAYPPDKYNINNYYIVINTGYSGHISGLDIKNGKNSIISAEIFLNNCRHLSKKQKELLQLLKKYNFYYTRTYYKKLFSLLREANLKIYWQEESKNSQLRFLPDSETKKIKASLNLDKIKYEYNGQAKKEFIFKLDESYKNKKILSLFFDQTSLVIIDDYEVSFQDMPDCLIKILVRINTKNDSYYYAGFNEYKKPFEVALNENEIIEINKIIENCRQYFNFSSKLKPNFKITEFSETAPCLLIDYDGQKNTLEAKASIDYGIERINVSQSVCRSRSGGRDEFNRMGEAEYV